MTTNQAERLADYNKILLEVRDFLNDVLVNESISDSAKQTCNVYITKLDDFIKPPSLPPRRSGRVSTSTSTESTESTHTEEVRKVSENGVVAADQLASQEFLEQQRILSRKHTVWKNHGEDGPAKPYQSQKKKPAPEQSAFEAFVTSPVKQSQQHERDDAIYERIGSISEPIEPDCPKAPLNDLPPPVPERKGRSTSTFYDKTSPLKKQSENDDVMVHDLQNPLYSGLLRNVKSNTKQWCVVKRQKLYLFNDLQQPATFIADLNEYGIYKDAFEKYTFHVRHNEKDSIILVAVDEEQYELWHNAFRRAKLLADGQTELREYISFKGSEDIEEQDGDEEEEEDVSYETPEHMMQRTISPTLYVSMNNILSSPDSTKSILSPPDYEAMDFPQDSQMLERFSYYSSMPLPPIPGAEDNPPELPERAKKRTTTSSSIRLGTRSDDDDSSSSEDEESISGSFTSLIESESESSKDQLNYTANTWPRNRIKGKRDKEVEFLRDLSAVYCGILHQRRMLAVWQKRFCKVKDQYLYCYRQPDSAEPSLKLQLSGYQLDRAEETWKSFSFKIYKESADTFYFSAENRTDLIKWISVLAKEMNKEKFQPTDFVDRASYAIAEEELSTEDSENSAENLTGTNNTKNNIVVSRTHSSDFDGDADSEVSVEGDEVDKKIDRKPKNLLLRVGKRGNKARARSRSSEDPDAAIQGYLYRKLKNHWSRRWCCIKDKKFLSYKNVPRETPDVAILLKYASCTIPLDDGDTTGYYMFKLRYEGSNTVMFSTKQKETWQLWTDCIGKYVGSKSEEAFPYINVPPNYEKNKDREHVDEDKAQPYSFVPDLVSSPLDKTTDKKLLTSNYQLPLPPRAPLTQAPFDLVPRGDNEINEAIHTGFLTELQLFNQSFRHISRFILITKDKYLKFYDDSKTKLPAAVFNAMQVQIVEEKGADPAILRLHIDDTDMEILLKASDDKECSVWKKVFERIHYEEIEEMLQHDDDDDDDDMTNAQILSNTDTPTEKMFHKRSKSIDKKDKYEPVLLSHSKTLPNVGKAKKRAKELRELKEDKEGDKSKTLPIQPIIDNQSREKKGLSSLIRSFTVDTLTRKGKNKSYEMPAAKEGDIMLKETQKGVLKQILDVDGFESFEDRFCRISGKVFYCYNSEKDTKPLFKVPLRNAAIEDFADTLNQNCRFQITAMDSGFEYTFLLTSEQELDNWVAALYGDDRLHKSLDTSPYTSSVDTKSPLISQKIPLRSSLSSPLTAASSVESFSLKSPSLLSVSEDALVDDPLTPDLPKKANHLDSDPPSIPGSPLKKKRSSTSASNSSLFAEEKSKLSNVMFEITNEGELSKTKLKRWVVLKKTVVQVYYNEKDKNPLKIINLNDFSLLNSDSSKRIIQIETSDNSVTQFSMPTDDIYRIWMDELKLVQKDRRRNSRDRSKSLPGNILWRKNAHDRLKDIKSSKDNRASMLLVEDDVRAIETYKESSDPSNIIAGQLVEYFENTKDKKVRHCWVKNGYFNLAKKSKPDKILKTIDLSTVVIIDESDPASKRYAFKLAYTTGVNNRVVYLKTSNQSAADKWMVAISMGILYHRLSGTQSRDSYIDKETQEPKDFEFMNFNEEDVTKRKPSRKSFEEYELGVDIKREITRKAKDGDNNLKPVSELLKNEFPSPNGSPIENRRFKIPKQIELKVPHDSTDGTDGGEQILHKGRDIRRFSDLKYEEDQVFNTSDQPPEQAVELLENIPERENAEEAFKNVKGILRQQESIRRGIIHRQKSNVGKNGTVRSKSSTGKKIPPKVKPKPKVRKASFVSYVIFDNFTALKETIENLSLADLRSYKVELEGERTSLLNCVKNMNTVLSDAESQLDKSRDLSTSESNVSELEYNTVCSDLKMMQNRLLVVEKELKKVHSLINRKVAVHMSRKKEPFRHPNAVWYTPDSEPSTPILLRKRASVHEDGYNSEPLLDDSPIVKRKDRKYSEDTNSIII